MEKIPTTQLLAELKELDARIELVPNPHRPGLSNLKLNGTDICPVPSEWLQNEHTSDYVYMFPNGMYGNMKTYDEAKAITVQLLEKLKDADYAELFFSKD